MFVDLKNAVETQWKKMQEFPLFSTRMGRDDLWSIYLDNLPEEDKQEHNCNTCKSFIRSVGKVVALNDKGEYITIWDVQCPGYEKVLKSLHEYVMASPIQDLFRSQYDAGCPKNYDEKRGVWWEHFFAKTPRGLNEITTVRDNKHLLSRGLEDITEEAIGTALEVISQGTVYRGNEFKSAIESFEKIKKNYSGGNEIWFLAATTPPAICRLRNSAIGTFLLDLSSGMDVNTALTRFEGVMAPTNYKRPKALVTPQMIAATKEALQNMGVLDSIYRRVATTTDVPIDKTMYVDRSSELRDIFDEMAAESVVNPRKLNKVEEISIEDFLQKVVPTCKKIELLVENSHLSNFASLITGKESPLFKWNNPFSWSYTGGVTDSIKERVKSAGGNVNGVIRVSLSWYNHDDLDLHVIEPGRTIYYGNKKSPSSGFLDVDMNAGGRMSRNPVENIAWTNKSKIPKGKYQVKVHQYSKRETSNEGFAVQIECGETYEYSFSKSPSQGKFTNVVEFEWDGSSIKLNKEPDNTRQVDKWGIKTNAFVKVKNILLSPNHWDSPVGNKHYLFSLEGCYPDEPLRPFFNEYLNSQLDKHKKVLEVLGGKVEADKIESPVAGLGFSETAKNTFTVRCTGNTTRTLKVKV